MYVPAKLYTREGALPLRAKTPPLCSGAATPPPLRLKSRHYTRMAWAVGA